MTNATQTGQTFVWGFQAADAPSVAAGFYPNEMTVDYEPEVYSTSENGEGHVDSVTLSKKTFRKGSGSITGRITADYDPASINEFFTWQGRKWFLKKAGNPRKKGAYAEVSIDIESFAGVA